MEALQLRNRHPPAHPTPSHLQAFFELSSHLCCVFNTIVYLLICFLTFSRSNDANKCTMSKTFETIFVLWLYHIALWLSKLLPKYFGIDICFPKQCTINTTIIKIFNISDYLSKIDYGNKNFKPNYLKMYR